VVNAVAAYKLYGGPAIIIDIGTAITFDTVSKDGDYLGGAIAPGIAIAMDALFNRTAALPRVDLTYPKKAIGTNTVAAMQSGIFFGYVGLIEGVVNRIKQEVEGKVKVIATGGYARLLAEQTKIIDVVDLDITLVGLRYIYDMNR
jgi:type III pantothenate kinase